MKTSLQKDIDKTFSALSKRGMTRAFIETEAESFIYPTYSGNHHFLSGNNFRATIFIAVILFTLFFTLRFVFNPPSKTSQDKPTGIKDNSIETINHTLADPYGLSQLHYAVIQSNPDAVEIFLKAAHPPIRQTATDGHRYTGPYSEQTKPQHGCSSVTGLP